MNLIAKKAAAVFAAAAVAAAGFSVQVSAADRLSETNVSVSYAASVSKPTYSIKGTKGTRKVRLSTSTSGATIYYTTDGSVPTTRSAQYTGLIVIKKNTKIKAIAVKNGTSSAVMTKTVRVATLLGDVTGDGSVNENDYTRLSNWIKGKTTYGCKDNADVNGSGKVNSKDLKILRQYLDLEIDKFPAESGGSSSVSVSSSISKPKITVYKVYGGKKIEIEDETSGATIYYTLNGKDPTKSSTKYTRTFIIDDDATVKAVAYKSGKYSTVKSRSVEVDPCAVPYADADDSKNYTDSVKVNLRCDTDDARIYYTTDGSDPVKYGTLYRNQLEFNSNTTLKIYATAKGYANSSVRTYNYKVTSTNYIISGMVWDDTPYAESMADGVKQYGENGINGITVKLVNTANNYAEQTVNTSTINGVAGSYIFDRARPGNNYKIMFEFNGQKYRAFNRIVSGGNQAVTTNLPQITIKSGGAYNTSNALLASVNSYNTAIVSSFYTTVATTNATYTSMASNVNLALVSNIYGDLNLSFGATSVRAANDRYSTAAATGQEVYSGDTITYTLNVMNDSPYQSLKSAALNFYVDQNLDLQSIFCEGSSLPIGNTTVGSNGMQKYTVSCPSIRPGEYTVFTVEARVSSYLTSDNVTLNCYAEVAEYTYDGSCYDKNSIPGNFSGRVVESDEAMATQLRGYSTKTAAQNIGWSSAIAQPAPVPIGVGPNYDFFVEGGTGLSDVTLNNTNPAAANAQIVFAGMSGKNAMYKLIITGRQVGDGAVVVSLLTDSSKAISINYTVTMP